MFELKDPRSWKLSNLLQLCDNTWRFDVSLYTSYGWLYIKGFRIRDNRLMPPSYHFSGSWPTSIVRVPRDLRDAIRKRVQKQIRKVTSDSPNRNTGESSNSLPGN